MHDNNSALPAHHKVPRCLTIKTHEHQPIVHEHFRMGTSQAPSGSTLTVDSRSLLLAGEPWLPVMGEFHYSRYPEAEWRDELIKMELGGISIVATYVFWIHHEEIETEFDWSGRRSLREFVRLCGELGLYSIVRCGPWCHGECRNGGLPDWLLEKNIKTRSNDPVYLGYTANLYTQIHAQIDGLLWKQGGPVIGIQLENEYDGPAEHLLALKRMAQDTGIDVPLYTRTGWPELSTPMPAGEILPLFGGYPDGFWDRSLGQMPPGFAENYLFRTTRNDASVATDQLGVRAVKSEDDNPLYPYFACEIGGGMMPSYHRRIQIFPKDIEALALAKLGSGTNLPGYYMYHGGANPEGLLSTLQESQATGYWNDLPVKSYDFQAPLGEFGQAREHYHSLRRMHLFLRDFGHELATMTPSIPPANDAQLRWCIRTDGNKGFLFFNNYQRLEPMPPHKGVQFSLKLPSSEMTIPKGAVTIPAGTCFFWPFNIDLGGARLVYATAQPICSVTDGDTSYFVFAQTIEETEFVFDEMSADLESVTGTVTIGHGQICIQGIKTGTDVAIRMRTRDGKRVTIILLDREQSLTCYKAELHGQARIFLTPALPLITDSEIRLQSTDARNLHIAVLPAIPLATADGATQSHQDGVFQRFSASVPQTREHAVKCVKIQAAGPARQVAMGSQGVAEPPPDDEFENAEIWRIELSLETDADLYLRVHYAGDIARLYLDDVLIADNFFNGNAFEAGLRRFAPEIYSGKLLLKILPLAADAPIYMQEDAKSKLCASHGKDLLNSVEVVERCEARFLVAAAETRMQSKASNHMFANPIEDTRMSSSAFVQ